MLNRSSIQGQAHNLLSSGGGGGGSSDPDFASVVALAGFDRAGDANQTDFVDESSLANTFRLIGTAGGSGTYEAGGKFDGRFYIGHGGSRFEATDRAEFHFGANPFTAEAWFNFDDATGSKILMGQWGSSGNRAWYVFFNGTSLTLYISENGSTANGIVIGGWTATAGTYHHIVAEYDGSAYRLYADGVMIDKTLSSGKSLFNSTAALTIGYGGNSPIGSVDEYRITNGVARYASDAGYTVPTAKFPRS